VADAKRTHKDPMYLLKFSAKYGSWYILANAKMLRDRFPDSYTATVKAAFKREFERLQREEFAKQRKK